MQVMTLLGSPRADGTTATVLAWIEEELRAAGHTVDHVHVVDHEIEGCRECWSCKADEVVLCIGKDEANPIYERMLAADVVLLASPVFAWGFPAQLKSLIDRMYCLVDDFTATPEYKSLIAGKPMALLLLSGGPLSNNADLVIRGFENMVGFLKAHYAGLLHIPFRATPNDLNAEDRDKALRFARELCDGVVVE